MIKLSDDSLKDINGGTGQGVDDCAVRIEMHYCPKCCQPGEFTRFEIKNGVATCLTCNGNPMILSEFGRA